MIPIESVVRGPLLRATLLGALVLAGAQISETRGADSAARRTALAAPASTSMHVSAIIRPVPTVIHVLPTLVLAPSPTSTVTLGGCPANLLCPRNAPTLTSTPIPTRTATPSSTAAPSSAPALGGTAAPSSTPTPSSVPVQSSAAASLTRTAAPGKVPAAVPPRAYVTAIRHVTTPVSLFPVLILRPSTAAIGEVVAFKLSGVTPSISSVIVHFGVANTVISPTYGLEVSAQCEPTVQGLPNSLSASKKGIVTGTFQVPSLPCTASTSAGGTETLKAFEAYVGHASVQASATLRVPPTTLTVIRASSRTLRLHGAGFEAGEYVYLSYMFGSPPAYLRDAVTAHAGAAGAFTVDIPASSGIYGSYSIVAKGLTSSLSATVKIAAASSVAGTPAKAAT